MHRTTNRLAALVLGTALALGGGIAHAAGGTGGGGTGGGGTGGGGTASGGVNDPAAGGAATGKATCVATTTLSATAGVTPGAMGITATYSLASCVKKPHVSITMTNLTTGVVEYTSPVDFLGTTVSYFQPSFATTYRVGLRVTAGTDPAVVATRTVDVTTMVAPPNCAQITNENLSAGYWVNWAAIWISTTVKDCGYGRETVRVKVTNLSTGVVEYDNPSAPMTSLIDYEGGMVSYDTDYQVDVEVHGAQGELLDSSSAVVHTPAAK